MKILMSSYAFYPSVGGIETVAAVLGEEFVLRGHELKVVTYTLGEGSRKFPYGVIRRPGALGVLRAIGWSDVALHINISLHAGWPMLLTPKPWVISHQTWMPLGVLGSMKQYCANRASNITISEAVAHHVRAWSTIIPNPYDDQTFRQEGNLLRDLDLVFVGRLVSDKGVDCALTALNLLKQRQIMPRFTIIGAGPEEGALRRMASDLGISEQVRFAGMKQGSDLARELSRHKIIVIPSLWKEPFGVVALEGIASGCVAVGSAGGGLKDAIGPCGVTFPNGDSAALADALASLLEDETRLSSYRDAAGSHLARCTKEAVAREYLAVMQQALEASGTLMPAKVVSKNQC